MSDSVQTAAECHTKLPGSTGPKLFLPMPMPCQLEDRNEVRAGWFLELWPPEKNLLLNKPFMAFHFCVNVS